MTGMLPQRTGAPACAEPAPAIGRTQEELVAAAPEQRALPQARLILALQCARPRAAPAAFSLEGLVEVTLLRGEQPGAFRAVEQGPARLQIALPDAWVSSRHARLVCRPEGWQVEDLGSTNGTSVNEKRVGSSPLRDGDLLRVGRTFFYFRAGVGSAAAMAQQEPSGETPPGLVSRNHAYAERLHQLRAVARSTLSVVLEGESGTGKEVLARGVHELSGRSGPLVAVNCGAIAPELLEAELFGHRKGAFSGATESSPGLVRASHGGTLFLDEIGEMPPRAQVALLRVLQERAVLAVGSTQTVPVDLRVVAATNRDLDSLVQQGRFRADLLARLKGYRLKVPPLRHRPEDVGQMIAHHLGRLAQGQPELQLALDTALALLRYRWPLNVRELEQALSLAVTMADGAPLLELHHLPEQLRDSPATAPLPAQTAAGRATGPEPGPAQRPLALVEEERRLQLIDLLAQNGGNVSRVGRALGKAPMQIRRWMARYHLSASDFRGAPIE
jgi:DNA-binding NtrC family response regulator